MEHGIHLEHSIVPKHQSPDEAPSLFIAYLQRVREEVRGRVVGEICRRFKLACRRSRCIRPETRYYMTGKLPEGDTKESEIIQNCTTTALHQCVGIRSYEAVEQLVKHGFVVDARDAKHWTALGYARATMQQDRNKEDPHQRPPLTTINFDALTPQSPNKNRAVRLNRIIGLLEQNTSHAPSSTYAGLGPDPDPYQQSPLNYHSAGKSAPLSPLNATLKATPTPSPSNLLALASSMIGDSLLGTDVCKAMATLIFSTSFSS